MSRVPGEDVEEVQADWKKASFAEKKQMVWDANANPHPHPNPNPSPNPGPNPNPRSARRQRDYLVEFEDENEPTGRGEATNVPQKYVLPIPDYAR